MKCRLKETIKVLDAKQTIYIIICKREKNLKM